MKKSHSIYLLLTFIISSCDPSESLEYRIENNTALDIKIYFVSNFIYPNLVDNSRVEEISSMSSFKDTSGATPSGSFGNDINSPFNYDSWKFESIKPTGNNVVGKIVFTINESDLNLFE